MKDGDKCNTNRERKNQSDRDKKPQLKIPVINIILEEPMTAGLSSNSRKTYAREVLHIIGEVLNIMGEAPKSVRTEVSLFFDESDLEGVKFSHDNLLDIVPLIDNSSVKRVLV